MTMTAVGMSQRGQHEAEVTMVQRTDTIAQVDLAAGSNRRGDQQWGPLAARQPSDLTRDGFEVDP